MPPDALPAGLTVEVDGRQRLLGARCTVCGTHVFPVQQACARCGSSTEPAALPAEGTLWSWTVQRLAPKPPFVAAGEFEPFAVGYVDLGALKIETRLAGRAADAWRIGDAVRLTCGEPDDHGAVWSFWFEEVGG
jgi:uncharacterized OB-fold protein